MVSHSLNGAYSDSDSQILWGDGERAFRRGWRLVDNGQRRAVLIVQSAVEHPSRSSLDRLTHEYELKDQLDGAWAVRPLDLVRDAGRTMLVLEDVGGEPLDELLGAPMEVGRFLGLAIAITAAMGELHQRSLVHKDIKPANVLDLTERKRAEQALRELESNFAHVNRVSMMGELAASLSHEITQPIASARNNANAALNFLDRQLPDLREVREALACVVGDTDRAGDIIGRIRDHMKKAPPRKDHFDLNVAINEVTVLARSAILKNGVSIKTELADGLSPVDGDRVQLQQVVLNLVLNAVEAMGSEAGARELLISTEQDQTGVLVAVRDTGPGIDPTRLERVFEAFYTTKPSGTGMGLSICRSIINAHGGRLWVEANEPRGALFQFTLAGAGS